MRHFHLVLLPALLLGALLAAEPAVANGVDLQRRAGKPGERIEVAGHDWLTCCPPNTPVEHVALFLLRGSERFRLFDVPASREGAIQADFKVPSVPAGTYRLEVCSRGPDRSGVAPGATCLPVEENFTVLAGRARSRGARQLTGPLLIGVGFGLVLVASALLFRRCRASPKVL
jgi:hypothetical protein